MDIGGIGDIQAFQVVNNVNDFRSTNTVPDHAAEQTKASQPITQSQKDELKERLIENGQPSSVKVEFERNQVPNTETLEESRGDNALKGSEIDLLA